MSEDHLHDAIVNFVPKDAKVLDLGSGLGKYHPLLWNKTRNLTLLDAHAAYLEQSRQRTPGAELILAVALPWLEENAKRRFDVVLMIDFVEHMVLADAEETISRAQRCSDRVAIFVPEGNHPQTADAYGMGGDYWQTHRSTWYPHMLTTNRRNFVVERWWNFHTWREGADPHALWATWKRNP